mmetsp:Transcript_54830/g.117074  ORF Transcript_54830/g.117074 Transcript_54830/m.117074 type:complete len:382 (-) Transcript_54830:190-1335(-)|eukprot:CAMPEP_0206460818 /NCGR_PEP_ID=MMETSP0324_2-20121206/24966_1 /ASSEMBLY_ACC=CAM_ASM_000836 /TAXON_ID=2866 /ORGANISM="Crypthecodinium cohnii, Strain Seligo" /LENGTH=381 /DNA_ID=CAMNT_0053932569 /DNA_START=374 /DNA_END=1519 /DNA_ORIENTATION=-
MPSEGLRRRGVGGGDRDDDGSGKRTALDNLKKFDVYSKVHDDFLQKSQTGGIVTVITALLLAWLFCAELLEFTTVEIDHSFTVDTSFTRRLPISLNVTLPNLRCDMLSIDTLDSKGEPQVNIKGSMQKISLDRSGSIVAERLPRAGECLSCLDGASAERTCCNTCNELKDAYLAKNLSYAEVIESTEQCGSAVGCRIAGEIVVSKASGNLHIALGESRMKGRSLVHRFNVQDVANHMIDTSHTIHSISFGDAIPGFVSPLDGASKTVRSGAYFFHYHIKLVPTEFIDRYGTTLATNQYSFTDMARNAQMRKGEINGLPGVFIVYDLSPFLMRSIEKVKPWSYLFTSSCALIGGAFSVASLVELLTSKAVTKFFGCKPGLVL